LKLSSPLSSRSLILRPCLLRGPSACFSEGFILSRWVWSSLTSILRGAKSLHSLPQDRGPLPWYTQHTAAQEEQRHRSQKRGNRQATVTTVVYLVRSSSTHTRGKRLPLLLSTWYEAQVRTRPTPRNDRYRSIGFLQAHNCSSDGVQLRLPPCIAPCCCL
ncbi:unnamed protein product, partial [Laminaria digitata]